MEDKAKAYAKTAFENTFCNRNAPWADVMGSYSDAYLAGAAEAIKCQWKAPNKEKPQDGQNVLIFTTYIGAKSGQPRTLVEQMTYFEQYGFWLTEKSQQHINLKVVAWMPIPELSDFENE